MAQNLSFRERLQKRPTKSPFGGSDDVWRYREAAAVLATFDAQTVKAHGAVSPDSSAKTELLADCDVAYSAGGSPMWSLRTPVRQAALRRLLTANQIHEALDSNPDREASTLQKLFESYLSGASGPMPVESPQLGKALLEVVDWLSGVPEFASRLPSLDQVKHAIDREQLLQPFRSLVGSNFAGRKRELAQLADYVGVQDAQTLGESIHRTVERIFSIRDRPPLFIYGPGGCGKSTLISRFILDHAEIETAARFPFAYLDFDRPSLVAEEPITFLGEIMRQLAIQFPGSNESYGHLADEWSTRAANQASQAEGEEPSPANQVAFLRLKERESFLDEFAQFVKNMKTIEQPLLLVLDTFEEVQFRSSAFAEEVLDFLDALQARVPRLRTVLAGRGELRTDRYKVKLVPIGDFDDQAAISFLAGQGIRDTEIGTKIFQQVGGSPLVLRLAADVARLENVGRSGIAQLPSGWLTIFRDQSVEIVLYKRILSHVYDTRVQRLAYPGLVLRVITPEVPRGSVATSRSRRLVG
jgi:cellulose synthase operon protein C